MMFLTSVADKTVTILKVYGYSEMLFCGISESFN